MEYHPRGIKREYIQYLYSKFISPYTNKKLTIALKRLPNIGDLLCQSKLKYIKNKPLLTNINLISKPSLNHY